MLDSELEINVDRLMHEIRESVKREQRGTPENISPSKPPQPESSPLCLQPEFRLRHDKDYHVDDLLKYHGTDFVRNAYRVILRREPDSDGWARHLEALASGRLNKIDVLSSLHYSAEGETLPIKISGLAWPARIRRLGRIPIFGHFIQCLIALARLPLLLRNQRQSEFYYWTQQEKIVDYINQYYQQLTTYNREFAAFVSQIDIKTDEHFLQLQALAERQVEISAFTEARLCALEERLMQQVHETTQQLLAELKQTHEQLLMRLEEQTKRLVSQQRKTHSELVEQEKNLSLLLKKAGESGQQDHGLDSLYAEFENRFRGDREVIKERLRVYLPLVEDAGVGEDVLDIGCGRGEWLELLNNQGVQARGLDRNRVFVEQWLNRGLEAVEEDALVYLRSLPDHSLNAITSFHVIEHLPFETFIKLLDEIIRTLRSGGLLILETPDPQNLMVGSFSFYADPTHRNPIPSGTLQFLLESRGLCDTKILKLRPWDEAKIEGESEIIKRFNEYFYCAPDYGILGRKA